MRSDLWVVSPADGEREDREQLRVVLVHRRVDQLPGVFDGELPVALEQPALDRGEPAADRAQRLDGKPALVGPLARRDAVPGRERRVEAARVLDAEVGEPGRIRASSTMR